MDNNIVLAFDFDGVVGNTIDMLYNVYQSFFSSLGIPTSQAEFDRYNGMKMLDIFSEIKRKYNLNETVEQLENRYNQVAAEKLDEVEVMPKLKENLEIMKKKGIKIIISSSARKDYIERFLKKNGLLELFNEIVTSEIVKRGKPYPDLYLFIKEKYKEYDVIVIEDSDNGLKAAFNAGVKVIFFNNVKRKSKCPHHGEINSFSQLNECVDKLSKEGYFIPANDIEVQLVSQKSIFNENEKKEIDRIWNNKEREVFNGRLLVLSEYLYEEKLILKGFWTEYKNLYAAKKEEISISKIIPISVSGIIVDKDNKTIALKRNKVTDYKKYFELAPSGSIEDFNERNNIQYRQQLIKEFQEELNDENSVENLEEAIDIEVIGICYDAEYHNIDICMKMKYNGKLDEKMMFHNQEYDRNTLKIAEISEMNMFLKKEKTVYTSKKILEYLCEKCAEEN